MSDGKIHSRFGGSIASRYLACAGSVALAALAPPERESAYAAEGTAAHDVAAQFLIHGVRCYPPERINEQTRELAGALNVYLDAVWTVWDAEIRAWQEAGRDKDLRPVLKVEEPFVIPLKSAGKDEVFGSNDAMIWAPATGNLYLWDYKHGAGVGVDVEDNKQLKFYAVGAVWSKKLKPLRIHLSIVQPRLEGAEPVKNWEMPFAELVEFFGELEDGVTACKGAEALYGEVPAAKWARQYLKAGDHCRWCPAAALCPAKEAQALEAAAGAFTSFVDVTADSLPAPETLDYARLGQMLAGIDLISEWGEQIRKFLYARLQEGETVPGWKLVEKIGRRKWSSDPKEVTDYLSLAWGLDPEHLMPRSLVTLTEVKKLMKAALTDKTERAEAERDLEYRFTTKESSGLTMVPDSSSREGVAVGVADFSAISIDA